MGLKYIINGTTPFSSMIRKIIEADGGGNVLCFTTLRKFIKSSQIDGLPIVATEDLPRVFDISEVSVVNTVGYSKMNTVREKAQSELDSFGLRTVSYISPKANVYSKDIENGCIIMPGAFVGPDVKIGKGNIIYSNVSLTHHITIGDYNFIASGCVLGGNIRIGNNCFIGLNSTLRNRLNIPSFTLIGCSSNVVKNIETENSIWLGNPAKMVEGRKSIDVVIK